MKLAGMEAQQISKLTYPTHPNSDKLLEALEEIKDEARGKIHCHFLKSSSSPVLMSHLTYSEISVEFTTDAGSLYADEESEENNINGELLYLSDCNGVGDQTQLLSHLPKPSSDEKPGRTHEFNLLKHKLSASTCSDIKLSSPRNHSVFHIDEMTNIDGSLAEDQENKEDGDIFTELSMKHTVLENLHKMYIFQAREDRYHHSLFPVIGGRDHNEKILKDYKVDVQTQSIKEGEWCESMLCLMKKLEQLNLDTEEALSVGSSTSGTPYTKRHKQMMPSQKLDREKAGALVAGRQCRHRTLSNAGHDAKSNRKVTEPYSS